MIAEVRSNSLLQRLIRGITGDETSHALVVVGSDELADANFCAGGPAGYITSSAESWDYFNPHGGRQGVIAIAVWYPPEGGGWGTAEAARALAGGLTQYASIPWGIGMNYATGLDWEPDRYHCFEFCLLSAGLPVAQSPEAFRQVLGANGWRRVALGP
jgi:hypothetical protein